MPKQMIKKLMFAHPALEKFYVGLRANYHRTKKLGVFWYDLRQTYRDMHWSAQIKNDYMALSAELLFQYHKLEKGLCMPGEKRFFGYDPASATLKLLKYWRAAGFDQADPVYQGALGTLVAYRRRLNETPPAQGQQLLAALDAELNLAAQQIAPDYSAVIAENIRLTPDDHAQLARVFQARKSVRIFKSQQPEMSAVERATQLAISSPSACNRQPWKLYVVTEAERKAQLLALQNGNRGFGHTAPMIIAITASASCFFDAYERHEPYVNGGLFAMSFMLALQAEDISSCCLNWSVAPATDRAAHQLLNIPPAERIIMLLAVGYAEEGCIVPVSPRRPVQAVLNVVDA